MKIVFFVILSSLTFLVLTSANLHEDSLIKSKDQDSKLSNLQTQKFLEKLSKKKLSIVQEEKIKVSEGDCSEDPNSEFGSTQCVCKQGYIGDFPNCVLNCQPFNGKLTRDKSACVCKDFFVGKFPYCSVNCNGILNSIPNTYKTQCLCKQTFVFNDDKTQCLPTCNGQVGYRKFFNECIIDCSKNCNSQPNQNGTECVCRNRYYNDSGKCIKNCSHFLVNSELNQQNKCVCKPGFIKIQDQCLVDCSKYQFSTPNDLKDKCVCRKQSYVGTFPDCKPIQVDCSSDPNSHSDQQGTSCICKRGFNGQFPSCIQIILDCPQNSEIDYLGTGCTCSKGFVGVSPNCIKDCSYISHTKTTQDGKSCICQQGYECTDPYNCEKGCSLPLNYNYKVKNLNFPSCPQVCGVILYVFSQQILCGCQTNMNPMYGTTCVFHCDLIHENSMNMPPSYHTCGCRGGFFNHSGICVPQISCQYNQIADYETQQCICIDGYDRNSNNQCIKNCSHIPNSVSDWDYCYCKENYQNISGVCIRICYEANQIQENGECVCKDGFFKNGNNYCQVNCSNIPNSVSDLNYCVCKDNYQNISGVCTRACSQQGEVQENNQCVCISGYIRNTSNYCQIDCSHIPNSVTYSGYCQCKENYQNISGVCTKVCYKENTILQNDQCVCVQGFIEQNGKCVEECFENSQLIGSYCQCIYGYSRTGPKQCTFYCHSNSIFNGQKCVCKQGYIQSSSFCVKDCSIYPGLELQLDSQFCICKHGHKYISPLQCIQSDCSQVPNTQLQRGYCVCKSGFTKINDYCTPNCSSILNSYVDVDICSCLPGFIKLGNKCEDKCLFIQNSRKQGNDCVCLEGYENISGHCIERCHFIFNSQLHGNQCVCKQGFQNITGYCMILPNQTTNCSTNPVENCQLIAHSEFIGGQCLCQTGYINISGICILNCSHLCHSYPNQAGDTCICADNYLMNSEGTKCLIDCSKTLYSEPDESNSKCVCIEGYLHVNDCCVKDCSQLLHSHPDQTGSKCICNTGYTFCKETKTCVSK